MINYISTLVFVIVFLIGGAIAALLSPTSRTPSNPDAQA